MCLLCLVGRLALDTTPKWASPVCYYLLTFKPLLVSIWVSYLKFNIPKAEHTISLILFLLFSVPYLSELYITQLVSTARNLGPQLLPHPMPNPSPNAVNFPSRIALKSVYLFSSPLLFSLLLS